jgi:hypothetical protein
MISTRTRTDTAGALAEAGGSLFMASLLFGQIYEWQGGDEESGSGDGSRGSDGSSSTSCVGRKCVFLTALVCAAACGVAVLLELWLGHRTRPRYRALYSRAVGRAKS